ncbi:MAG TPA: AAA family ATPase [Candidatus Bathyarchaeota archaeon]|nr:AAA family ATPase [Candidatus Bathyarchaeota archaeon]
MSEHQEAQPSTPPQEPVNWEQVRRGYHTIPPLMVILDTIYCRDRIEIDLKEMTIEELEAFTKLGVKVEWEDGPPPEELARYQPEAQKCLLDFFTPRTYHPEVCEVIFLGLIGYFAIRRYSHIANYLFEARREGNYRFINILRCLCAAGVIRADVVAKRLEPPLDVPWARRGEPERYCLRLRLILTDEGRRELEEKLYMHGLEDPRWREELCKCLRKCERPKQPVRRCEVPYRTIECVENIFRILESYGFVERISPRDVRKRMVEEKIARLHGFEYQFELLAKIAYLTFSPHIHQDPRDVRPVLVLVFGYPGTGKTAIFYLLLQEIMKRYGDELEMIEAIKINCQRLTSLLEPEEVKEFLRVIEHWIDNRGHYVLLFLDEAEGIAFERGTEKASARRELTFWVMSLWDKKKRLLVVLVTNYPDLVDDAVRNRADFVVYFMPALGRYAARKNIKDFTIYFWRRKLFEWLWWGVEGTPIICREEVQREEKRRYEKALEELVDALVRIALSEEEQEDSEGREEASARKAITDIVEDLAVRLTTNPECVCNPRNLYEGIKTAVRFHFCHEAPKIPGAYVHALRCLAQEIADAIKDVPEEELEERLAEEVRKRSGGLRKDFKKLIDVIRAFMENLEAYLKAFGGIFPLHTDIANYEDRYCDLLKAARRSMRSVMELRDQIEEIEWHTETACRALCERERASGGRQVIDLTDLSRRAARPRRAG